MYKQKCFKLSNNSSKCRVVYSMNDLQFLESILYLAVSLPQQQLNHLREDQIGTLQLFKKFCVCPFHTN